MSYWTISLITSYREKQLVVAVADAADSVDAAAYSWSNYHLMTMTSLSTSFEVRNFVVAALGMSRAVAAVAPSLCNHLQKMNASKWLVVGKWERLLDLGNYLLGYLQRL